MYVNNKLFSSIYLMFFKVNPEEKITCFEDKAVKENRAEQKYH
jgi:hypothetical protein